MTPQKKQQGEQLLGVIISSVSDLFLYIYTFYFLSVFVIYYARNSRFKQP